MSHEFYVWMSYGMTAVAIAFEIAWLRVQRARALRHIREESDLEAQD
jgi:heme exporter protein CcmD